ncbi:MAG: spore coat associated protein CotJA, partial [Clostridia bacterium]|nr:spore coat associated protein CotJA [Clostridia bacterium]
AQGGFYDNWGGGGAGAGPGAGPGPEAGLPPDLPAWPPAGPGGAVPQPGPGSYVLPAGIDLTMAFVPIQSAASYRNQFPLEEALRQGSLWPDLVRPYTGRPWRTPAGGGRAWTR